MHTNKKRMVAGCVLMSVFWSAAVAVADSGNNPLADVLDVVFNADGTAVDVSVMQNTVELIKGPKSMTYYDESLDRHVAWFDNTPGNNTYSGYYKVNFENNVAFRNALSDGYTMEALISYNDSLPVNKEMKPFSAMQAGGLGFLLSNNNPAGNDNKISFISHLGGNWQYANGDIRPSRGTYYHVVGVWDKANNESRIYINGELKDRKTNSGAFQFAASGSNWFCIGGDAPPAGTIAAEAAWRGNVAAVRIYNDPIAADEVAGLWGVVKDKLISAPFSVNNIIFLPETTVQSGSTFTILADGFKDGDDVRMISTTDGDKFFDFDGVYFGSEKALRIKIGEDFESGEYKMFVVRDGKAVPIGTTTLTISDTIDRVKITAHRGYWTNGSPQNSIASFKAAYKLDVYNAESDYWLTKDNVVVCFHDQVIQGRDIPSSNYYGNLEHLKLANGEPLPVFQDYLNVMNSAEYKDSDMKFLVELKPNNNQLADAIVAAVAASGLENKVEYIAFSYALCQYVASIVPQGTLVGYINGDIPPNNLAVGINCMNYEKGKLRSNPGWVKEAHNRGLFVSVWTISDSIDEFMEFVARGVDCISTDHPHIMQDLLDSLYWDLDKTTAMPTADVLDVVFKMDGSAEDISPMANNVQIIGNNGSFDTYYNETYDRHVAKINNQWGTASLGESPNYGKVDFEQNAAFKAALADGYTLETFFRAKYTPPIENGEAKWFSAHEAGGTGLMVSKTDAAAGRGNELTFLPNVSPTGSSSYIFASSGVVPEADAYYHVVAVWNKAKGKASIYVDGALKKEVPAVGNFVFPKAGANWFGIGCDAGPAEGQFGGSWEMVTTRIYDKPLSQEEVSLLWQEIEDKQEAHSSFEEWMAQFESQIPDPADRIRGVDPDGDGATNFEEFAFGGHPANPASRGVRLVEFSDTEADGNKKLTLTIEVRGGSSFQPSGNSVVAERHGISYQIKGSHDLSDYNSPVSEVIPHLGNGSPSAGYEFKTFRLDASNGLTDKGFLRAQAEPSAAH